MSLGRWVCWPPASTGTAANSKNAARNAVEVADTAAMFRRPLWVILEPAHSAADDQFRTIGTDRKRRRIFAVFTLRNRRGETPFHLIGARHMHKKEI